MPDECVFCRKLATLDQMPADEIVWRFPHSVAFLAPFQFYQGYCILASRLHATELSQLDDEARLTYLDEMCIVAKAIEDCFQPKKLNYEMLGNQTAHMHWHVIPRYAEDPDALHPIWTTIERARDDRTARHRLKNGLMSRARIIELLQQRLQILAPSMS